MEWTRSPTPDGQLGRLVRSSCDSDATRSLSTQRQRSAGPALGKGMGTVRPERTGPERSGQGAPRSLSTQHRAVSWASCWKGNGQEAKHPTPSGRLGQKKNGIDKEQCDVTLSGELLRRLRDVEKVSARQRAHNQCGYVGGGEFEGRKWPGNTYGNPCA